MLKALLSSNWKKLSEKLAKTSAISSHLLNLKNGTGFLDKRFLDLPPSLQDPHLFYLRRQERFGLPLSYRTGLVFFASVMLVFMLAVTAIDAQTLAVARQSRLQDQIADNFVHLSSNLETYSQGNLLAGWDLNSAGGEALNFSGLKNENMILNSPSNKQSKLVEIGLKINNGYQQFQSFIAGWESDKYENTLEKLNWMKGAAEHTVSIWNDVSRESEDLNLSDEEELILRPSLVLIAELNSFLEDFLSAYETLIALLGADEPQRILVFVQDPNERRATGGALTAGLEILLDEGELIKLEPFFTSDYDQKLMMDLQAPAELREITSRWNLSNANSFLNVSKSAERIQWFWQREARSSADLVVLINTSLFERLFNREGLVPLLPEQAALFKNTALQWTARNYNGEKEELKKLMLSMFEEIKTVFLEPRYLLKAWPAIKTLVAEKELMMAGGAVGIQNKLEAAGLSFTLPKLAEKEDVLLISSVSMLPNSGDRLIDEDYELHTSIKEGGAIKHWLKISRNFPAESSLKGKLDFYLSDLAYRKLLPPDSKSQIRIFVPKGTVLDRAENVDLNTFTSSEEGDYTIWSFVSYFREGDLAEFGFFYELPWKFDTESVDNYRLQLIKQPGTPARAFEHQIKFPALLSIFQELPAEPISRLDRDITVAVVAGKNP